ncbi:MAG: 30S ribosomal protein S16 [Planctomycetes bacterium]|nr:30S ribosomal protein S16 [Planctomycetota bacterium]
MAVRIRLKRFGRKNRPYFRIEVFDARTKRDGKSLECVGTYDPLEKNQAKQVTIQADRVKHWLSVGALPSETVASFLRRRGIEWKKKAGPKKKDETAGMQKVAKKKGPPAK